jgi:hypothetical protein
MNNLLKKLNYKDQKNIVVLNAPDEFSDALLDFSSHLEVIEKMPEEPISFLLLFIYKKLQIDEWAVKIEKAIEGDALLWWAYPKSTSKKYKCDFNRDVGWQKLGDMGYEPVGMVAIDENWSALRFRKVKYIKKLSRDKSWRMSEEGKNKN